MTEKIYIRGIEMAKADDLLDKQETLVSGNNIKTINGTSILGSGDITISGDTPAIDLSNYITKDNTVEYIPTEDYNPTTKLYVDTEIQNRATTLQTNIDAVQNNLDNKLPKLTALHVFEHTTDNAQFTNWSLAGSPFATTDYVDGTDVILSSNNGMEMWSIQTAGYYRINVSMNVKLQEGATLGIYIDRDWNQTPIVDAITPKSYNWTCKDGSNSFTTILYLDAGSMTACAVNGSGALSFAGTVEMTRIK